MNGYIILCVIAEGSRIMTQEMIELILHKLEKIETDVSELKAFKNKLIGMGVGLSAIFAYIFDVVKDWINK